MALIKLLNDQNATIRAQAAREIAEYGPSAVEAIPDLVETLQDTDTVSDVRASAAYALGEMGPKAMDAVPDLVGALRDETKRVQKAAAKALIKIFEK